MKTITKTFVYRKLRRDEPIKLDDLHSLNDGKHMATIKAETTIGRKPRSFSKDRTWWRIIREED